MRIAIIGCGGTGTAITARLARKGFPESILCIDSSEKKLELLKGVVSAVRPGANVEFRKADAKDSESLKGVIGGCKAVINSASPTCNIPIMRACLATGTNYIDLASDPFEYPGIDPSTTLDAQFKLDGEFRDAGLLAVTNAGFAPGLTDILCAHFVSQNRLQSVESVEIYMGESVRSQKFVCSWSPYIFMLESAFPPTVYRNGRIEETGMDESVRQVSFPKPLGKMKVRLFSGHPELRTITEFVGVPVKRMEIGGGYMLNGLDLSDIVVWALSRQLNAGTSYSGDLLQMLAEKFEPVERFTRSFREGAITADAACGLVTMRGTDRDGREVCMRFESSYDLRDTLLEDPQSSVTEFMVAFMPCALARRMLAGELDERGVIVPAQLKDPGAIVRGMKELGLKAKITTRKSGPGNAGPEGG
jgi:saccharopine dehydrogenase (NAD+, L-lysine-forming)